MSNRSSQTTWYSTPSATNTTYITEIKAAVKSKSDDHQDEKPATEKTAKPVKQLDDLQEEYLPLPENNSTFNYDDYSLDQQSVQSPEYSEETSTTHQKEERPGLMTHLEAEESIQELNVSKALNDGKIMDPRKREQFNSWLLANPIWVRIYESFAYVRAQNIDYATPF